LLLVLAASFHHLTVADEGDRLSIRFGPLPLFSRSVQCKDILAVELGRRVHLSLRGGWVWNIWGRDRVVLRLRSGTLRVGTNDAENLAQFVQSRLES